MGVLGRRAGVGLLSGAANVIMQLARPGVGYGVKDSRVESGRVDRHPIKRARTTFTYLAVALVGHARRRRRHIRRAVNKAHAQVYSTDDSPVEYNAFDKNLQLWVGACLYKGVVDVYRIFVGEMDDETADRHYREGMALGTTLQVPAEMWPADRKAFDEYWQESLDQIHIDDAVREYLWPIAAGRVARCHAARAAADGGWTPSTCSSRPAFCRNDSATRCGCPGMRPSSAGSTGDGGDRRRQQRDAAVRPAVPVQLDAAGISTGGSGPAAR